MIENEPPPSQMTGDSLGKFALLTILLVTLFLTGGLIADRQKVTLAIVCGVTFFTLFGGMVIVVLSGQLTSMVSNHQREKTMRIRDELHFSLYQPSLLASGEERPLALSEIPSASDGRSYVPAVPLAEERIKVSAYEFINNLYTEGVLDPKRVLGADSRSPDQIQLKKPRPEVLEYLLSLGIVRTGENRMLFYNTARFSSLIEAKRAIKIGRKEPL